MPKKPAEEKEASFEELMKATELLAERMEQGELSLDESMAAYQQGVGNLRRCAELLRNAEEKVKVLLEANQGFELTDLDDAEGDAGEDDE